MATETKAITGAAGILLLPALLTLTLPDRAFSQVGSTVGTSARVIEAGPAWAAHHDVQNIIQRLLTPPDPAESGPESVEMTERASTSRPCAHPRSGSTSGSDGGLALDAGSGSIAYCEVSMRNARLERSVRGGPGLAEPSATLRPTVPEGTANTAGSFPGPAALVIYIQHVAN